MSRRSKTPVVVDLAHAREVRESERRHDELSDQFLCDSAVALLAVEETVLSLALDERAGAASALPNVHKAMRAIMDDVAALRGGARLTVPEMLNEEMECIEEEDSERDALARLVRTKTKTGGQWDEDEELALYILYRLQEMDSEMDFPLDVPIEDWLPDKRAQAIAWLRLLQRSRDAVMVMAGMWHYHEDQAEA